MSAVRIPFLSDFREDIVQKLWGDMILSNISDFIGDTANIPHTVYDLLVLLATKPIAIGFHSKRHVRIDWWYKVAKAMSNDDGYVYWMNTDIHYTAFNRGLLLEVPCDFEARIFMLRIWPLPRAGRSKYWSEYAKKDIYWIPDILGWLIQISLFAMIATIMLVVFTRIGISAGDIIGTAASLVGLSCRLYEPDGDDTLDDVSNRDVIEEINHTYRKIKAGQKLMITTITGGSVDLKDLQDFLTSLQAGSETLESLKLLVESTRDEIMGDPSKSIGDLFTYYYAAINHLMSPMSTQRPSWPS